MSVIFTHLKNTSLSRTLCFNFLFFLSLHLSFFFFASSCKGSWRRGSWKVVYRVFDYILEIWWWIIILRCVKGVVVVILHLHVKVKLLFKCRLRWDLSLFLFFFFFVMIIFLGFFQNLIKKISFFCFHGCLLRFLELCNEKPFLYFAWAENWFSCNLWHRIVGSWILGSLSSLLSFVAMHVWINKLKWCR